MLEVSLCDACLETQATVRPWDHSQARQGSCISWAEPGTRSTPRFPVTAPILPQPESDLRIWRENQQGPGYWGPPPWPRQRDHLLGKEVRWARCWDLGRGRAPQSSGDQGWCKAKLKAKAGAGHKAPAGLLRSNSWLGASEGQTPTSRAYSSRAHLLDGL